MAFNKSYGTLRTFSISLTNGTPSGTLLPAPPPGQAYYLFDLLMTTNDTAAPLVTLSDSGTIAKFYVSANAPTLDASSTPIRCSAGSAVTVSASAVTAAKTVEIKCVAIVSAT
jgi:hypothetical protein